MAEYALHHACKLQPRELILLRVAVPQAVPLEALAGYSWLPSDESLLQARKDAENYLADVLARYVEAPCPVRALTVSGDEAGAIVDSAENEDVDLIVMTTHGYSGLTRWVLGSVTERVLRQAPCPVLAVRDDMPLHDVIITVDGSLHAESAVAPGLELTDLLDGHATFIYVDDGKHESQLDHAGMERVERGLGHTLQASAFAHGESYVENLQRIHRNGPVVVDAAIQTGKSADEILRYAEAHNVDVIVMATHGRSGLRRWVYGSVTEKVLRGAQCALMVVRVPTTELV
jgi:nucleotide-binding universal stress UspA family protein